MIDFELTMEELDAAFRKRLRICFLDTILGSSGHTKEFRLDHCLKSVVEYHKEYELIKKSLQTLNMQQLHQPTHT